MQKNKPLTSIIILAYDLFQLVRNMTQIAIESIVKYTDEEDYELIFIDTIPKGCEDLRWWTNHEFQLGEQEDRQWIKRYLSEVEDPGQYACYNIGAKLAKGDYLCFTQNDVIVMEGWLDALKYYLDKGITNAIVPDQQPKTRNFVKESYEMKPEDAMIGNRDAGMIMMTREAYDSVGGWDERMKVHYGEKLMYEALAPMTTCKTMIVHIQHGSGSGKWVIPAEKKKYEQDVSDSAQALNKPR